MKRRWKMFLHLKSSSSKLTMLWVENLNNNFTMHVSKLKKEVPTNLSTHQQYVQETALFLMLTMIIFTPLTCD